MSTRTEAHDVDPERRTCEACGGQTLAMQDVRAHRSRPNGPVLTRVDYRCTDLDCHAGGTIVEDEFGELVNAVGPAVDESFGTTGGQIA